MLKAAKDFVIRSKSDQWRVTQFLWGILRTAEAVLAPFPEPTDPVERSLIEMFNEVDESYESLENELVGEMIDCGGQPQFLDTLPRFVDNVDFGILVTNLSQCLDEHPLTFYYGSDGKPVGEGVKSQFTNEEILRLCLCMVTSKSHGNEPIKFLVVGKNNLLLYTPIILSIVNYIYSKCICN